MVMHVCPNPTTTAGPSLFLRPRSSCGPMSLCSASTNGRTSLTGPPPDGISSPWRGGAGMGSRWRGRLSPGRSPWKPASRTHVRLPRAGPPIGSCWLLTTSVAPGARAAPLLAPQAEAPRPPPVLWGGVDYFSRWAGGGVFCPALAALARDMSPGALHYHVGRGSVGTTAPLSTCRLLGGQGQTQAAQPGGATQRIHSESVAAGPCCFRMCTSAVHVVGVACMQGIW